MKPRQRILVVEQEPVIGRVCNTVLRQRGFSVDIVSDGEHAISTLQENRYDLCIMDMRTPVIDGARLYSWMNDHSPELVRGAIFTTADIAGNYRPALAGEGEYVFLEKPFTPAELVAAVEMALN